MIRKTPHSTLTTASALQPAQCCLCVQDQAHSEQHGARISSLMDLHVHTQLSEDDQEQAPQHANFACHLNTTDYVLQLQALR